VSNHHHNNNNNDQKTEISTCGRHRIEAQEGLLSVQGQQRQQQQQYQGEVKEGQDQIRGHST